MSEEEIRVKSTTRTTVNEQGEIVVETRTGDGGVPLNKIEKLAFRSRKPVVWDGGDTIRVVDGE